MTKQKRGLTMIRFNIFQILLTGILILLPINALTVESPHESSNGVNCQDCHQFILTGGKLVINLPRGNEQETVCKNCHNPAGLASGMSSISNHVVNNGNTIIDCGSCHDPHNPDTTLDPHTGIEAVNLKLIRGKARHVDTALDLAIFQERPANFAFDENSPPWNGICQTCHTQTAHHTNDNSTDHQHEQGQDCTSCHTHEDGFMPSGGDCAGCHSNPQNNGDGIPVEGRRPVVEEFPTGSAGLHAHYGSELNTDGCLVCHSVGTHMDGYVELVDPDNSSLIYRFISPGDLTSDPDLSSFCSHCHDDDGAQRLSDPADPFGNGNSPANIAVRFSGTLQWDEWYGDWCFGSEGTLRQVNSHHDISDSDQAWSGAKIECLNCHGAHNASADTPIADPSNQILTWSGTINEFCLTCHYGGNGPLDPLFPADALGMNISGPAVAMRGLDAGGNCGAYNMSPWWVDYTWTFSPHGSDSKRGWEGYSGAPGYELDCTVCHDPHGSYSDSNTLGNPYMIRDFVDGTQFVDDGVRPGGAWTGPPWDNSTLGTSGSVVVTITGTEVDWGSSGSLCIKCHANWLSAYDWHAYCNGCMTCHGHGQSWDGNDWGQAPDNSTNCSEISGSSSSSLTTQESGGVKASGSQSSCTYQENPGKSCSECHDGHRW